MTEAEHKYPPSELMMIPRWIVADEKKKPIPGTAAKDKTHWTGYDAAYQQLAEGNASYLGVTFYDGCEQAGYRLMAVDIDSCFDDEGRIEAWAKQIVDYCDSYTERSPSGNGLHIFVKVRIEHADYPGGKHYVSQALSGGDKAPQVQVIGGNKAGYCTVTGDIIEGVPDRIAKLNDMKWLLVAHPPGGTVDSKPLAEVKLEEGWSGEDKLLSSIARSIQFSKKDHQLLLAGEWSSIRNTLDEQFYPSASEAFFALVHLVLKHCDRDGEKALEFLMSEHTGTWSKGCVEHSVEPEKYAMEEWVRNRVKKATEVSKGERPEFDNPFDQTVVVEPEPYDPSVADEAVSNALRDLFGDVGDEEEEEPELEDLGVLLPSEFRALFGGGATFMVKDLIPATGVIQFYGKPKNGKSLITTALAAAVASGSATFFGKRVFVHGPVLVLVGEDQHGVANRTRAQELIAEIGEACGHADLPIYLTKAPANTSSGEGLQLLKKQMEAINPVLVISDTQIANAGALDENDTKEMGIYMRTCERISQFGRGCVFALVHHTAKSGRGGARGSGVQGGAVVADFEIIMSGGSHVRLIPRNCKNWRTPDEIRVPIEERVVTQDPDGNDVTAPGLDFRVEPSAAASGLNAERAEEEETGTDAPAQGDPAAELLTFSLEHGRMPRTVVSAHMFKAGFISEDTVPKLRYLEQKLMKQGQLHVDSSRSKTDPGVLYRGGK